MTMRDSRRGEGWDELEVGARRDDEGAIRFYKAHYIDEECPPFCKEFDGD